MIDLGQLEAFLQVAEHSSFSRAAEALFLTQPTISARIHALERELGELLFERSSRSVRLTEAGQTFLPYAKRALEVYREGRTALDSLRQAQGGRLRLGASRVFGTYLLPDILHVFKQRHPGGEPLGADGALGPDAGAAAGRRDRSRAHPLYRPRRDRYGQAGGRPGLPCGPPR
ncbi:MAG: hypothetical protein KatS3mg061_2826 [Dehalococcoidia bacterium]|nr:MAG: hypothetical protein KatS3mg061_2826 [Dehalococcoidia bacterium]